MRLTLRTLLAYLDDTLEPAQTKLIGQKVAESKAAQELIARIKDVVRRRRLTTPSATGPSAKIDANAVADYIDNVLPAEQLAEIEEICLGSDVHLAEIAACHQILSVVLSEPILVPPTARRRMYALNPGREAIPYRKVALAAAGEHREAAGDGGDEADATLLLGLPLYSRQGSWFRRLAPIGGVLLLAAALVAAIVLGLKEVGSTSPPGPQAVQNPEKVQVAQNAEPKVVLPADKQPVEPAGKRKKSTGTKPKKTGAQVEGPTKPKKSPLPSPVPKGPVNPAVKPVPHKPARRVIGSFVTEVKNSPSALLQRRQAEDARWERLVGPKSPVHTEDSLVSLPGYRSELRLDNGVRLLLWGNLPLASPYPAFESEVVLNDNPEVDLDLGLKRGRITLANYKNKGPATIKVRFERQVWDITLLEPGSEVLIEFWATYPPGIGFNKDGKGDGPEAHVEFFVTRGEAQLKIDYVTHGMREPPGPAMFSWNNSGPIPPGPDHLDKLPDWLKKVPLAAKQVQGLQALAGALSKEMVDRALPGFLKDQDPMLRAMAVVGLGAIDDLRDLLDALADENFPEVRLYAAMVLRHWIALDVQNDQKLYNVMLQKKYNTSQAETIMALLHLYPAKDLAERATWESLIAYLNSTKLAIRELAYGHLRALVPADLAPKIPFDAAGPSDQREAASAEWKRLLDSGQLPPKLGPPPPPAPKEKGQRRGAKKVPLP